MLYIRGKHMIVTHQPRHVRFGQLAGNVALIKSVVAVHFATHPVLPVPVSFT